MKRGIVMSIQENHAVVMTQDGQFLKAPLKGSPVIGQELVFEEEAGSVPRRRKLIGRSHLMRYVGSAAAVFLIVAACLFYAAAGANPVVAYVTMDINPSIEIGVDDKEKVRELRAMNEAGSRLIEDIDYKGQALESVAKLILEKASSAHYLDAPHKDILIASILMNGSKAQNEEFEKLLTQSLDDELRIWLAEHDKPADSVTITTLFVPAELRSEADSIGISAGKMALYLMAKNEGYTLELDSLKQHSIDKATASIGGVEHILGDAEDAATKAKLGQLLKQEQEEKAGAAAKPTATATAKPTNNSTAKPSGKPTAKPTAKPTSKPTQKPAGKPSATAKPSWGNAGNWDDWDDWKEWSDKWKNEWSKEELEKLKKEWEKAGKDWQEQWEKWAEDREFRDDKGKDRDDKGNGKNGTWRDDDKDRSWGNGNVSWNNGKGGGKNDGKSAQPPGGNKGERNRDDDGDRDQNDRYDAGRNGGNESRRDGK